MNTDFKELLKTFNEHGVKYLVVGGYAVMKHSEPRFTKDLDIWVEASLDNAENFNPCKVSARRFPTLPSRTSPKTVFIKWVGHQRE